MTFKRWRLYTAGLVAFLIGMPLTERAFGQVVEIVEASLGLTSGIIASARQS